MDFSYAIRFFAFALSVISAALVPLVLRREPSTAEQIIAIGTVRRARWPLWLTRFGFVCVLFSFLVLLTGCFLAVD